MGGSRSKESKGEGLSLVRWTIRGIADGGESDGA
jgi:hypothetical protein